MNKKIMSKLIVASVLVGGVNFLPMDFCAENLQIISVAHAEVKTVEANDIAMFDFGENDTQIVNSVKNMARTRALQAAREKAGIYLQSQTQVVNGVLTKDDISAVTNNILEIMDVRYERSMFNALDANDNPYGKVGIMYTAYVTVKIDTNGITEYLQKSEQEKAKIIEQDRNFKNSVLESVGNFENVRANAKNQNLEQVHSELQKIDKEITATEKISEGNKLAYQNNYFAAVSKYNEALEINPADSAAKKNLESVYSNKEDTEQIIKNFDEEIKRNPKNSELYFNRGLAYCNLGKIYGDLGYDNLGPKRHFDPASLLNPVGAVLSIFSKRSEPDRKSYRLAIKDFDKAIKINPNYAEAYYQRGFCYQKLGNYKRSTADFAKARELGWNG